MQSLWFLWDIFINILEFYFTYRLLQKQLGYAKEKQPWIVLGTVVLIMAQSCLNYLNVESRVLMACMYVLFLLYAFLLFRGTPAMRIMWGSAPAIVFIMGNLLVYIVVTGLHSFDVQAALAPSFSRMIPTSLYIAFCALMFWLLAQFPRSTIMLPRNLQLFIIMVILIGTGIASQLQAFAASPDFTESEHMLLILFTIALTLMLLAFFFVVHRIGEAIQKEADTENKLESAYLEQKNTAQLQEVIRTWNHDQHHFIAVMQTLLERGDMKGIEQYLGQLNQELEAVTTMVNTGNPVLDVILENKMRLCRSEHILFRLNANNVGRLPISDIELTALIGNILDNAIEACKEVKHNHGKAFIDFQIKRNRKMVIITTVNSSSGSYKTEGKKLLTTKREEGHGYGLRRIEQIVKGADGTYQLAPSSDRFKIEVFIPDTATDGGEA